VAGRWASSGSRQLGALPTAPQDLSLWRQDWSGLGERGELAPGTPSGTYTLTVTATYTSGSVNLSHKQQLTLTVQ
jgi:hypothetical protein